jgi:RNA polymerase sigma-70 factor (ECF subfamily)
VGTSPDQSQKVPLGQREEVAASGPQRVLAPGERRLLEEMYLDHGPAVWRIVFAWTGGDRDIADEAVAESFARAGRYLDAIRDPRRWLITTALNVAKAELRRRHVVIACGEPRTLEHARADDDRELLMVELTQIIRGLPLTQRTALVLRDVFGYPVADISAMTGRSRMAIRVHLHRARFRVREILKDGDRI